MWCTAKSMGVRGARRRAAALLAIAGLSLAGCQTNLREGAAPPIRVTQVPAVRYNSVGIVDKSLEDWNGRTFDPSWVEYLWPQEKQKRSKIAVEATNSRRTPTGTLEVWAMVRNRTDRNLQIEGRVHFYDGEHVECEPVSAWRRLHLPPQAVDTYREASTRIHEVAYYYIEIREGR